MRKFVFANKIDCAFSKKFQHHFLYFFSRSFTLSKNDLITLVFVDTSTVDLFVSVDDY